MYQKHSPFQILVRWPGTEHLSLLKVKASILNNRCRNGDLLFNATLTDFV